MVQDPTQDDEAPELRKLLDEMHGSESSLFASDDDDNDEEIIESNAENLHSNSQPAVSVESSLPAGAKPMETEQPALDHQPLYFEPPEEIREELKNIPITLECSLRSLNKTLGEASQLQVGEILPLGCGPEGPVELRANGRTFARARLVMVEEQLAVEIIEKFQ